jgi:hypothetical protein
LNVVTAVMSSLMVVIGVGMIVITFSNGGGPLAFGLLVGVMFIAAGAGRLWTLRR